MQVNITEDKVNVKIGDVINLSSSQVNTIVKSYKCGEAIGGHKVVYLENDKIYIADYLNLNIVNKIVGVTRQAGNADDYIEVVIFGEIVYDFATSAGDYYLFTEGTLRTSIANNGIIVKIGKYIQDKVLFVDIGEYIIRN
jgi:intein-encoded DNA endonuclease-like protein